MNREELRAARLALHLRAWAGCELCSIGKFAHIKILYRGFNPCELLFVGEAPGMAEEAVVEPFAGKSGILLEEMIAQVDPTLRWGFTNSIACRPCDAWCGPDRAPCFVEVQRCQARMADLCQIVKPRGFVLLGKNVQMTLEQILTPNVCIQSPTRILLGGGVRNPSYEEELDRLVVFHSKIRSQRNG